MIIYGMLLMIGFVMIFFSLSVVDVLLYPAQSNM